MNLPDLSISRYVLAYMLSGLLVLFGLVSYERIGVDRSPDIDMPMVMVATSLPGANPEIIDSSVTSVIESAVNAIPGIEHIESHSRPSFSVVAIQFDLDKSGDVAFNEVQAKVNQVLRQLPKDADPPVVAKVEFGSLPIRWLCRGFPFMITVRFILAPTGLWL